MDSGIYVGGATLAVILLGHAIYIGYRMGQLTQALEDVLRRMVAAEQLTKKIHQIDDMVRRLERAEYDIDKLQDDVKKIP